MPPHLLDLTNVTLAVLAGGEGSRMGYPKAEIRLGGRPILHLLLEQFEWPGPTLLVTAPGRERPTGWELFTREATDPVAGQGPLRGLLTALENSPATSVIVTAVDMPFVRGEHLRWLAAEMVRRADSLGLIPRQPDGPIQPLPSVFSTRALPLVRRALDAGRRSVHGLAEDPRVVTGHAPSDWGAEVWTNLNSPEDLV